MTTQKILNRIAEQEDELKKLKQENKILKRTVKKHKAKE